MTGDVHRAEPLHTRGAVNAIHKNIATAGHAVAIPLAEGPTRAHVAPKQIMAAWSPRGVLHADSLTPVHIRAAVRHAPISRAVRGMTFRWTSRCHPLHKVLMGRRDHAKGMIMRCPMWLGRVGAVAAAAGVAWLLPATPARADDNSYLAKLRGQGVVVPLPSGAVVHSGHMIWDYLHRGLRPEDVTSRYFPSVGMPQLVAAAQTELCPDTIS